MEEKKILKQYAFSLVVILCLSAFLCSIIAVREITRYNMDRTPYETVAEADSKAFGNKIYEKIVKFLKEK